MSPEIPDESREANGSVNGKIRTPAGVVSRRQAEALSQASQVVDSLHGGESYLDGFNLLGVVANPRGLHPTTAPSLQTPSRNQSTNASSSTATTSTDVFSGTYHSIEMTMTSVTEQITHLNAVLEDWSRFILEQDNTDYDKAIPDAQLLELPAYLGNMDLQSLQTHLERSGALAHAFRSRQQQHPTTRYSSANSSRASSPVSSASDADHIPEIFYSAEFDLTDPETFGRLLLTRKDRMVPPSTPPDQRTGGLHEYTPVSSWFPLEPPEAFSLALDKVELSLLQQVRTKSGAFFEESLRFAQLQQHIQNLLAQTQSLQNVTTSIERDGLSPLVEVPRFDDQRQSLQTLDIVLEAACELYEVKSSIGGYLAGRDDLHATLQIQLARRLLNTPLSVDGAGNVALIQLTALENVSSQLDQYEMLVTSNLQDELVEFFLEWNVNASPASPNAFYTNAALEDRNNRVRELVHVLTQSSGLPSTLETYRNRVLETTRLTVRTVVSECCAGEVNANIANLSLERFLECLDLMIEQLVVVLSNTAAVDEFCVQNDILFTSNDAQNPEMESDNTNGEAAVENGDHEDTEALSTPIGGVVVAAAELSCKSIAELLRLRKDAHSLVSLEEMKRIWDVCFGFVSQTESMTSGHKAATLRSTLMAQAKAFIERKHERNMSSLVAALDAEQWTQCQVSPERQGVLTRLCAGRSVLLRTRSTDILNTVLGENEPEAQVEGSGYKVVWSCLLLVEMFTQNIAASSHFTFLASNLVAKTTELLRLFNSRTTTLVLGAGAIHSAARLKSINAKHLSLVTQCLGMILALLPHVRAAFMAQMPTKQHVLLNSLDQIKSEYSDHNEKVLNKFVTIIGSIVERILAPKIGGTDFDKRATVFPIPEDGIVPCCAFLDGIFINTRKMHQVLSASLPSDHLQDVFSRIFAFLDQKIPVFWIAASESQSQSFVLPLTEDGKRRMLFEVQTTMQNLNALNGVQPWDFTAMNVLERRLEYFLSASNNEASNVQISPSGTLTEATLGTDDFDDSRQSGSTDESTQGVSPVAKPKLATETEKPAEPSLTSMITAQIAESDDVGAPKADHPLFDGPSPMETDCEAEKTHETGLNEAETTIGMPTGQDADDGQALTDSPGSRSDTEVEDDEPLFSKSTDDQDGHEAGATNAGEYPSDIATLKL
jgi:hypothetical protein